MKQETCDKLADKVMDFMFVAGIRARINALDDIDDYEPTHTRLFLEKHTKWYGGHFRVCGDEYVKIYLHPLYAACLYYLG